MGQGIRKHGAVTIIEVPEEEVSLDDLLGDGPEEAQYQKGAIAPTRKGRKAKEPKDPATTSTRPTKGKMVTFLNKAGERIIGMGVHYYVVRAHGRLHYKEASNVIFLPDDWKEGDPIEGLPPGDPGDGEPEVEEDLL